MHAVTERLSQTAADDITHDEKRKHGALSLLGLKRSDLGRTGSS